ncbi:uncharacterized protein LOC108631984 [Ceratina calcarata]|uniref:Uncharacterized protein LOC108625143 n=1 Tax=Ceratina calcarata TaxID=156304 RepID=A0AAJ7IYK0_9HYME|nr:uncharacterized protein LOC108625143 [Ceratina calcarata]XP_017891748.1 uncharacterized protein LOC108631984 [Ceratina calcarata]
MKDLKTEILTHVRNSTSNSNTFSAIQQIPAAHTSSSAPSTIPNSPLPNPNNEMWVKAVGRKSKKKAIPANNDMNTYNHNTNVYNIPTVPTPTLTSRNTKPSVPIRKPRNVEVLYITENKNSNTKISQVLTKAKENINIQELGICAINPRASLNGGLILEFPKSNEKEVAPILMEKIKSLFPPGEIAVSCPKKYKEALSVQI